MELEYSIIAAVNLLCGQEKHDFFSVEHEGALTIA